MFFWFGCNLIVFDFLDWWDFVWNFKIIIMPYFWFESTSEWLVVKECLNWILGIIIIELIKLAQILHFIIIMFLTLVICLIFYHFYAFLRWSLTLAPRIEIDRWLMYLSFGLLIPSCFRSGCSQRLSKIYLSIKFSLLFQIEALVDLVNILPKAV